MTDGEINYFTIKLFYLQNNNKKRYIFDLPYNINTRVYKCSTCMYYISMVSRPHDEHRSFGPRRENFVRTSNFFGFLKELYKNKFKNLIRTSKFKLSFRGLD
jgi:hypothetical protein